MKLLFGSEGSRRLNALARSPAAIVFDFDGTLAPIVTNREEARMRRRTSSLLTRVCSLYPCAVVSGRSRSDTLVRLDGAPVAMVYGSHGLEPGRSLGKYRRRMGALLRVLDAQLSSSPGIEFEDKGYSLAVHFRGTPNRRTARQRILDVLEPHAAAIRLVHGKCVINVLPIDAPHKGDAVDAIQKQFRATHVLYVGDDVTDEDAFRYAAAANWITVRVGRSRDSAASYYLKLQQDIDLLLARLATLRKSPTAPR